MSCAVLLVLLACGNNYYIAGRTLPPSGILNRVMYTEQTPNALPFVDAYYDVRHNTTDTVPQFAISGYTGLLPTTVQNMPEQQTGAVYGQGDGSLALISYATEKLSTTLTMPGGLSNSIFISDNLNYVFGANDITHVISVADRPTAESYALDLPGVVGVSVNPGGTIALAFIQNSTQAPSQSTAGGTSYADFSVYSVVKLTQAQSLAAANNPHFPYNGNVAEDCEPQNLPAYCVYPVSTGAGAQFDHPIKAVFSSDGTTAYVMDCGPECGGTTAGITAIPLTAQSLNPGGIGASGINLAATAFYPIPNGATNANFNGNLMYIAGQQCQNYVPGQACAPNALFGGYLTVFNTTNNTVTGVYPISDGSHTKMVFGDENTLWIGSTLCNAGVRYQEAESGQNVPYGCLTMFNTSTNTATIDAYKGDATGIAPVTGLDKVYTAEGGGVYIYSTANMSSLDNSNVTVAGTVVDVAYIDAASDADNTDY
jgi:hypothetical protein